MTSDTSTTIKHTLWVWPTGLFPRRILYYLRAKALPLSLLDSTLTINTVLNNGVKLVPAPGYESHPDGTSLPCLRVERPGASPTFIYESTAIMEYFEELFEGVGGPSLIGNNIAQRARTRDIVAMINDTGVFSGFYAYNKHEATMSWSGFKKEEMSDGNVRLAVARGGRLLAKIEKHMKDDMEENCISLSGEGIEGTLADFAVMAIADYMAYFYGALFFDDFGEFAALKGWYERAKSSSWFVSTEECQKIERDGYKGLFVEEK
jgi:glutathione S-transferase